MAKRRKRNEPTDGRSFARVANRSASRFLSVAAAFAIRRERAAPKPPAALARDKPPNARELLPRDPFLRACRRCCSGNRVREDSAVCRDQMGHFSPRHRSQPTGYGNPLPFQPIRGFGLRRHLLTPLLRRRARLSWPHILAQAQDQNRSLGAVSGMLAAASLAVLVLFGAGAASAQLKFVRPSVHGHREYPPERG